MDEFRGYASKSAFVKAAWPHRDQKLTHDPRRDAPHVRRVPNAFAHGHAPSVQSSLYLTDCDQLDHDTFAFCPGSHLWPDEAHWVVSADRHQVTPDASDIAFRSVKLAARSGDLVLWYSTTIHWGHPGVSATMPARAKEVVTVPMWRSEVRADDIAGIRAALDRDGACVVPLATPEEVAALKAQFVADANALFRPEVPYARWTDVPTIGSGKGGSAAPTLTLSRWAWDAKLLPARVALFRRLLGEDDVCVGLDSVHWNPRGHRLCSMASFSPTKERSADAFKRKCVAAAWGRWRTTHWAAHGDLSKFCYGSRFDGPRAFAAADPAWVGWAAANARVLEAFTGATFGTARSRVERLAASLTADDAALLVKPEIRRFL